jgi:hypothetical protein
VINPLKAWSVKDQVVDCSNQISVGFLERYRLYFLIRLMQTILKMAAKLFAAIFS